VCSAVLISRYLKTTEYLFKIYEVLKTKSDSEILFNSLFAGTLFFSNHFFLPVWCGFKLRVRFFSAATGFAT